MSRPADLVIVLVTPDGPGSGGGTQQVVRRMIPRWVMEGRHVTLLTHPVDERWDGIPEQVAVVPLPAPDPHAMHSVAALLRGLKRTVSSARTIRRTVRELPGRVVLPFLPGTGILALVACWGLANRIVPCERNDPTRQRFSAPVRLLRRLLYRRADAVTVNTQIAVEPFRRMLQERVPVHLVLNPLPDWPRPPAETDREPIVLSVGRLVPQKRHEDVIRAFVAARRTGRGEGWRLEICGEGAGRGALERTIRSLSAEDDVHLRGHVEDVAAVLIRARVLVLASEYEGTANALLEGLHAGLRVIASDAVPPLPVELDDGRVTRFPIGEVETLSEMLCAAMGAGVVVEQRRSSTYRHDDYSGLVGQSWRAALDG